ncbi:hypothetical protein PanWU01x14_367220, partial [Parasponia andersonii]
NSTSYNDLHLFFFFSPPLRLETTWLRNPFYTNSHLKLVLLRRMINTPIVHVNEYSNYFDSAGKLDRRNVLISLGGLMTSAAECSRMAAI